jgi:hypothetical protein
MTLPSSERRTVPTLAVKALRDRTGAPWMECKAVLAEANGDMEKAEEILRQRTSRSEVQSRPSSTSIPPRAVLIAVVATLVLIFACIGYASEGPRLALFFAVFVAGVGGVLLALQALTGNKWPPVTGGGKIEAALALFRSTTGGTRAAVAFGALVGTIAGAVHKTFDVDSGWRLQGVREVIDGALTFGFGGAIIGAVVGALVSRIVAVVLQKIEQRPAWWKVVHGLVVGATAGGGLTASAWESFLAFRVLFILWSGHPIDWSDWLGGVPELAALGASLGAVAGAITARSTAKRQEATRNLFPYAN